MNKGRLILWALAVVVLESGCTHYNYPPNQLSTASSLNSDLIASRAAPKMDGYSSVNVLSMSCQGSDYVVAAHYEHNFDKVIYAGLQYQVVDPVAGGSPAFSVPAGTMDLDATQQSGDVQLIIPGSKIVEKNSEILLRLKLRSKTVFESISPQEEVHVSTLCN